MWKEDRIQVKRAEKQYHGSFIDVVYFLVKSHDDDPLT